MHLIYIDEVKYDPPNQPFYWLCGFAVDQDALSYLDDHVREVARWYFKTEAMQAKTEFHCHQIVSGKGPYKGHTIERRVDLLKRLVEGLCGHESIKRIEVRIDPSKIVYDKDPAEAAFMFFVEKADRLMKSLDSLGVLIADDDSKKTRSANVSSLSNFRQWSTGWYFGRKIEHIVDTIHHTSSHQSRMVQLADVMVYCCQLKNRAERGFVQAQLYECAAKSGLYNAATYKYWPTDQSPWYADTKNG